MAEEKQLGVCSEENKDRVCGEIIQMQVLRSGPNHTPTQNKKTPFSNSGQIIKTLHVNPQQWQKLNSPWAPAVDAPPPPCARPDSLEVGRGGDRREPGGLLQTGWPTRPSAATS